MAGGIVWQGVLLIHHTHTHTIVLVGGYCWFVCEAAESVVVVVVL